MTSDTQFTAELIVCPQTAGDSAWHLKEVDHSKMYRNIYTVQIQLPSTMNVYLRYHN